MVGPELRIYPPSSTQPYVVSPDQLRLESAAGFPAQLSATFSTDHELYAGEDDPANPLQRGAYCELHDGGACLFRGKLKRVARTLDGGVPTVAITALDKLAAVAETLALHDDGDAVRSVWSRSTPATQLGAVRLHAGHDYGAGFRHVWYPDPASAAWLSTSYLDSVGLSTELGAAVTALAPASGARLQLAQTHGGLPPAGFLSVGSEWIEYNGYALDPADGHWYAHSIRRGSLGTLPAAHSAAAMVYPRLPKRIEPRGRIVVEGTTGATYSAPELLQLSGQFRPGYESGGFAFGQDPLKLRAGESPGYGALWASYSVFDEEHASALRLSDVLADVLSIAPEHGGPGLGGAHQDSCTLDIDLPFDPRLTRVVVDKPTRCLEFIRGLLDEIGLLRGTPDDAVLLAYDSAADTLRITTAQQASTPQRSYDDARRRHEESGGELRSAVHVAYESGAEFNLVSSERIWHTPIGLPGGTPLPGGAVPFGYQKVGGAWRTSGGMTLGYPARWNISQNSTAPGAGPVNLLTDNEQLTGIALLWDTLPAAATQLYAWFPGATNTAPDRYYIREVHAVVEIEGSMAGASGGGNGFGVELQAYDTFSGSKTATAPLAGASAPLNNRLALDYSAGSVSGPRIVTLHADNLFVPARAIGLRLNGYLDHADCGLGGGGGRYGFKLLELSVRGVRISAETVRLAATYDSADSDALVAPEAATKLLDAHMGQHSLALASIGPATRQVAAAHGWLTLLQALAQSSARSYAIAGRSQEREGVCRVGETVGFGDGFAGIADTVELSIAAGLRELTIRAVDLRAGLVGSTGIGGAGVPPAIPYATQLPPPRRPELRRAEELRRIAAGTRRFTLLDS